MRHRAPICTLAVEGTGNLPEDTYNGPSLDSGPCFGLEG